MHPGGRPSDYTPEIAETICNMIAEGWSVRQLTRKDCMPAESAVYSWLTKHPEFAEKYARAKEHQAERFAEEIAEIADDGTNDWIERENENGSTVTVVDHEHIQRSKLRVDTRRWLMSKMAPKRYGDKTTTALTGPDGGAIEVRSVGEKQAEAQAILDATFGAAVDESNSR